MSRRPSTVRRCIACRMHFSLCICALIPRLATRTRLVLVMHRAEARKSTNTGRLAAACVEGSTIVIRGREDDRDGEVPIQAGTRPLLLYPAADAVPLTAMLDAVRDGPEPITLVVPDGNWRQAAKMRKRVAALTTLPCVTLPEAAPSRYFLRAEAHTHALSTIEAVARAMGLLEGPAVEAAMLLPFRAMVERTLWARGRFDAARVTGGIPPGAERHDPDSGDAARGRATCPS